MIVRHYFSSFSGDNLNHHYLTDDFGKSNTDITFYRPDIVSNRAQIANATGSNKTGLYDFPDGKDTGDRSAMYLRQKGLDRVEVDETFDRLKIEFDLKREQDLENVENARNKSRTNKLVDSLDKIASNPPAETSE